MLASDGSQRHVRGLIAEEQRVNLSQIAITKLLFLTIVILIFVEECLRPVVEQMDAAVM